MQIGSFKIKNKSYKTEHVFITTYLQNYTYLKRNTQTKTFSKLHHKKYFYLQRTLKLYMDLSKQL